MTNAALHGCEQKIRSACASQLTQRDWCELWAKAKKDALKGRTSLLALLLPIVARKMPEENHVMHSGDPVSPPIYAAAMKKLDTFDAPNANA